MDARSDCDVSDSSPRALRGLEGTVDAAIRVVTNPKLREHLSKLFPDHRIVAIDPLAPDSGATKDSTTKAAGYGKPVRVTLADADDRRLELVWRVASANEYGHDRRADRAANTMLAYDDFARIPQHVKPIDLGAVTAGGDLISLLDADELYLVTTYAPGTLYADDLRRIARVGATDGDIARVDQLARYLAGLHVAIDDAPGKYRRSIRDLVGHGEGVFGIVDGYPADVPGAPLERLEAIERRFVEWRWRLRDHEGRLCRIHGDFHPFNVVFDGDKLTVLDASRGTAGDPADDVTAMAINYILFALDTQGGWRGLAPLWRRFWTTYSRERPDPSLSLVAPPFFAWRALVVCNPGFYPSLGTEARSTLLGLAECALDAHRLDPAWADELFR
jgi:phosphotransferase family enzyme